MPQADSTTSTSSPAETARAYDPLKRLIDVSVAAAGLVLLAPLFLVVAAAVKLTSRGPAIYRARRAGTGGEPFDVLKFRTMVAGADREGTITAGADPRVTGLGRFLRRTKIDELPQLWNVLRGEMSLVGPRPESLDVVERHYSAEHRQALTIRPGLTCPGNLYYYLYQEHLRPPAGQSVEDFYADHLLDAKIAADLHYVLHRTLSYDLRLICETAWILLLKTVGITPRWQPPVEVPPPPADFPQ